MELIIVDSADEQGRIAADHVEGALRGKDAPVLGVATGSSPLATYRELERRVADGRLDLSGASAFALDEYVGIPADDPRSYADTIRRTVTEPLGLDPDRVHVPDGMADDLAAGCQAYERAIRDAGGVDVQVLGIGGNGHIGFNEPGSSPDSRTRVEQLTEQTRRANARYFDDPEQVPSRCVTQGLATIMAARALVLVADGEQKAEAVAAAVEGPVTTDCPASLLQHHPNAVLVVDRAAASRLRHTPGETADTNPVV